MKRKLLACATGLLLPGLWHAPEVSAQASTSPWVVETDHPLVYRLRTPDDAVGCLRATLRAEGEAELSARTCPAADPGSSRAGGLLAGLLPDRSYDYRVFAEDRAPGEDVLDTGRIRTGSLPAGLAQLEITAVGEGSAPVVVLSVRGEVWGGLLALDRRGRVVWYHESPGFPGPVIRRRSGTWVYLDRPPQASAVRTLYEVTMDGRTLRTLTSNEHVDFLHHDVVESPSETLYLLTRDDTTTAEGSRWVGDRVVEWDPESGEFVERWGVFDAFDPLEWPGRGGPDNYAHANSMHLAEDGTLLVSLSFLDAVVAVSPASGETLWTLGVGRGDHRIPEGADAAFSSLHTVSATGPERLLLFDNGLQRAEGPSFSRALELQLGDSVGVVRSLRADPDIHARNLSSAYRVGDANTLVLFGSPRLDPHVLIEFDGQGREVWRVEIRGADHIYRGTPFTELSGGATR